MLNEKELKLFEKHKEKYGAEYVTIEKFKIVREKFRFSAAKQLRTYYPEELAEQKIKEMMSRRNSPYDPKYIAERDNISIEEAKEKIKHYKKDKNTSLESFIKRHGKEKGEELFKKFQNTSDSKSLDFYIKKYGEEEGVKKFNIQRYEGSRRCVPYWIKRGFSLEEAKKKVSEYQKKTSGCHKEYYELLGYSDEDIEKIFEVINKKRGDGFGKYSFLSEMGFTDEEIRVIFWALKTTYLKNMNFKKVVLNLEYYENEFKKHIEKYSNKEAYYKEVWFYTNISAKNVENIDIRSKEFHLDHKYSIIMGFLNNISPKIIGSIANLEIISGTINQSKRANCSIHLEQLLKEYHENYK